MEDMRGTVTVLVLAMACWMAVVTPAMTETMARDTASAGTVFLDAGHGGADSGATRYNAQGAVDLREKDISLAVALKAAELLRARGYSVVLSRETDERPGSGRDINGDGRITHRDGLQAVVDLANESNADLFISLHGNSSGSPTASGLEVYYCADREFADKNLRLAELVQDNLLQALRDTGYQAVDRGVKDDSVLYRWRGRRGHLFVLGPARSWGRRPVHPRAIEMPSVLAEALFLSHRTEAALLASEEGQWALARGYTAAVEAYFGEVSAAHGSPLPDWDGLRGHMSDHWRAAS